VRGILAGLLFGLLAACTTPVLPEQVRAMPRAPAAVDDTQAQSATWVDSGYRLSAGDVLEVRFPFRQEYNTIATVRPDGYISLPQIAPVRASGRTVEEVREAVSQGYGSKATSLPPPSARRYLIHPNDLLEVRFPAAADLNDSVRVRPDGRISLALAGTLVAEGRTPEELETELRKRYSAAVPRPEMVLIVREFANREFMAGGRRMDLPIGGLQDVAISVKETIPLNIYVGGEVVRPNLLPIRGRMTAVQAVLAVGGAKPTGDLQSLIILRRDRDDTPLFIVRNVAKDINGLGAHDMYLQPFDVVVVPRTHIANVQQFLDQYLYSIIRPLANGSFGFTLYQQLAVPR
jgi:polysaccharide export outer membrane protein